MSLLRWILVFVILSTTISQAQTIDSLQWQLNNARKKGDVAAINRSLGWITREYSSDRKYDSAYQYAIIWLNFARGQKDTLSEAQSLNAIAAIYDRRDLLDSSLFYYDKSIQLYELIDDTVYLPTALANQGIVYKNRGFYEKALRASFGGLPYLERSSDNKSLATSYNTIGSCYSKLGRHSESLDYYVKALRIRVKSNNIKGIAVSYNNIGNEYGNLKQYDSAVVNLKRSLAIRDRIKDKSGSTLHNLADIMAEQGAHNEAVKYYFDALERKRLENDNSGLPITLNSLARIYLAKGDTETASKYLNEADSLCRSIGLMQPLRYNLELKMALYDSLHDTHSAYKAAKNLLVIKDSLLDDEMARRFGDIQSRYDKEKYEQEIELYKAHTLIIGNRNKMLTIVVTLTIVIALLLGYSIIVTRRNKRSVELLLKELHHRVKNNLQVLSSLLSLQSQQLTDSNAIQAVKASESRVNAMALIHRKLYLGDVNRTIDIRDYVTELVNYLAHTYGYYDGKLKLNLHVEDIAVDVDKAIPLGLILNELISNAFKYAYTDHETPELYVSVSKDAPGSLLIQVRDNGQGMPEPKKGAATSFGLKMVNTLTRELRGKLAVSASQGTTYVLNIPL